MSDATLNMRKKHKVKLLFGEKAILVVSVYQSLYAGPCKQEAADRGSVSQSPVWTLINEL